MLVGKRCLGLVGRSSIAGWPAASLHCRCFGALNVSAKFVEGSPVGTGNMCPTREWRVGPRVASHLTLLLQAGGLFTSALLTISACCSTDDWRARKQSGTLPEPRYDWSDRTAAAAAAAAAPGAVREPPPGFGREPGRRWARVQWAGMRPPEVVSCCEEHLCPLPAGGCAAAAHLSRAAGSPR